MDPLADLLDADEFAALLAREELRRARTEEPLAVAVLDLDGLGAVNADYGPAAGAELLRRCAEALRRTVRGVDELSRTGHDEFSILLHATDADSAAAWSDRFEETLGAETEGLPAAPVTCSLGIADTAEAPTLMEVFARARRRMEVVQTVRKLRRARESESGS